MSTGQPMFIKDPPVIGARLINSCVFFALSDTILYCIYGSLEVCFRAIGETLFWANLNLKFHALSFCQGDLPPSATE